jgi:hypothetical protein
MDLTTSQLLCILIVQWERRIVTLIIFWLICGTYCGFDGESVFNGFTEDLEKEALTSLVVSWLDIEFSERFDENVTINFQ